MRPLYFSATALQRLNIALRLTISFDSRSPRFISPHGRLGYAYLATGRPRTAEFASEKRFPTSVLLRSSLSYHSIAVALVLGLSLTCVLLIYPQGSAPPPDTSPHSTDPFRNSLPSADDFLRLKLFGMPDQIQPGRPGNLTPEQEAKLRDLWQLVAQISGVYVRQKDTVNGTSTPSTPSDASPETPKRKRRGLSMFIRKYKDETEDDDASINSSASLLRPSTPTPESIANSIGDEDKHGVNRAFKQALSTMTPDEFRDAFWSMVKHDHPDALLLRFLRARKWDVNAALVMAISALHWRKGESKVDEDIMFMGEEGMLNLSKSADGKEKKEGDDFMAQIRMGKSYLHGADRQGRPLCFVRVRLHRQGEQSETSLERYTVYTIETARMFLRPPVDTATIVFDMTDFSMANMDYAPVKFMIKCFEANYPESLGAVLVHKAPWIFQGIWKIIKGWLDPVVAGKVHFTNDLKELEEFIDLNNIVKELGGPGQWEYKYQEPQPYENKAMQDYEASQRLQKERQELAKKYEEVVLEWVGEGLPMDGMSKSTDELRKRRDEIALQLRDNYWELDPYVRARSVYDRTGELMTPGKDLENHEKTDLSMQDFGDVD